MRRQAAIKASTLGKPVEENNREMNVFDQLHLRSMQKETKSKEKLEAEKKFSVIKKDLLSAIAYQISKDKMLVHFENGVEPIIESIDEKYLSDKQKYDVLEFNEYNSDIFDLESVLYNMIEATAKKIGSQVPVYRIGQWNHCEAEGSASEVFYSANKEATLEWVRGVVKDICEANKDCLAELGYSSYDDYLNEEMSKVFCYRVA